MSESIADFHKLSQRLRLTGTLTTRTALRIGSGGGGELDGVDLPVLRDATSYPLIPGGSFKGSIRSTIEALVRGAGYAKETGIRSCNPLADKKGMEDIACGWHAPGERKNVQVDDHCAVCQLFGSQVLSSHVRFTDLMISTAERKRGRPPVEIRDGVAIDRDLRVAANQRKYDFEVVAPGVHFDFELFVDNPKPWLMGLLLVGFDQLREGFTALGGFTSRGLGRVDISWSEMTIVSARDLLEGTAGESLRGEALEERFRTYRKTLAARAKGDG